MRIGTYLICERKKQNPNPLFRKKIGFSFSSLCALGVGIENVIIVVGRIRKNSCRGKPKIGDRISGITSSSPSKTGWFLVFGAFRWLCFVLFGVFRGMGGLAGVVVAAVVLVVRPPPPPLRLLQGRCPSHKAPPTSQGLALMGPRRPQAAQCRSR